MKGPITGQAPKAAAPVYGAGGGAAVAPRLPSTGTGGLLPQSDASTSGIPIVAGLLAVIGAAASTILLRRRSA